MQPWIMPSVATVVSDTATEAWVYNADMDAWKGPTRLDVRIDPVPIHHNQMQSVHRATVLHAPNRSYVVKQYHPSIGATVDHYAADVMTQSLARCFFRRFVVLVTGTEDPVPAETEPHIVESLLPRVRLPLSQTHPPPDPPVPRRPAAGSGVPVDAARGDALLAPPGSIRVGGRPDPHQHRRLPLPWRPRGRRRP